MFDVAFLPSGHMLTLPRFHVGASDFPEARVSKGYKRDDLTALSQCLPGLQVLLSAEVWHGDGNGE